jgi:hypothetical protein
MLRALEPLHLAHLTLTILKIGFQMRKLCASQIKGTHEKNHQTLPKPVPKNSKKHLYVVLLLLKFKDDL